MEILPWTISEQLAFTRLKTIDIPPVENCTQLRTEQEVPVRHHVPDVQDYPQLALDDQDPKIRETKRQENVEITLRMIDDALRYSR